MSTVSREDFAEEANRLIFELGLDSIAYLVAKISDAVRRNDDETVGRLDAQLRIVETKLAG